jgi:acetoacetyl-CoA synthetase
MPFNAPLYIMYSSGTTGVPKCIVHGTGGTLLQHLKELALHSDVKANDRLFYYTTCGWMMWNWLVSGLACGATLVLFDGSPFAPTPASLWDIAEQEDIAIFGASAKYYAACEKAELEPAKTHQLKSLRTLLSTGSPLAHESFDYVYQKVKQNVCLSSISGGTDIVSCFALGCPTLPVYRGELQCSGLGMDVDFIPDAEADDNRGELICRTAFPSMPVGFWNDESGDKYHNAYFDRFEGIWAHGDFGEIIHHHNPEQYGVIIHGRSDAVLNPGGVRIGTAEIYRQVEKLDEVLDAIAIGQKWQDDVRVVLFIKLRDGLELTSMLEDKIRKTIRSNTTPRHVPAKILTVTDIPRTISGKIVELAVRNVVHGKPVKNTDALANPEALEQFRDRVELL